ncbi:MAG TPA: regulatory signaling modulator protein AmpE [Steroidobacteraceae bacterium]|nr:regulatory signaling modulator protein AmpE [Steroidobacteraceae bacterium]
MLALVLALALERLLTDLLHLRDARWLDGYFDWAARVFGRWPGRWRQLAALSVVMLPVLPVGVVSLLLGSHLLGMPQLLFAVAVLLISFGPRDLKEEVDDYVAALAGGDPGESARRATELLEYDASGRGAGLRDAIEDAIFVQANNRIFGVIFWFMLLGPAGAWLFRVSDLMRRRGAFEASRHGGTISDGSFEAALRGLHGVLAWLPARFTALSYAVAGSFEDAFGNWKGAVDQASATVLERSEDLLARVGRGSLAPSLEDVGPDELDLATARGAWRIVRRALWIWLAVIALLVLAGNAA